MTFALLSRGSLLLPVPPHRVLWRLRRHAAHLCPQGFDGACLSALLFNQMARFPDLPSDHDHDDSCRVSYVVTFATATIIFRAKSSPRQS